MSELPDASFVLLDSKNDASGVLAIATTPVTRMFAPLLLLFGRSGDVERSVFSHTSADCRPTVVTFKHIGALSKAEQSLQLVKSYHAPCARVLGLPLQRPES